MGMCDCDAFNWRSLLFFIAALNLTFTTGGVVVLSKAKNVAESVFAFYNATNALAAMAAIFVCLWKKRHLFELIHNFESLIEKSEFA